VQFSHAENAELAESW